MAKERSTVIYAWLLVTAFVGLHLTEIGWLQHNIDEGANIYSARLIQEGKAPFRDFFYQQPPLYIYLLSLLPTNHFVYGRLVSLMASAATGLILFAMARKVFGITSFLPLLVILLYFYAGLQYFVLLAMPTSSMLFFSVLGVWLMVSRPRSLISAAAAGSCLAVSVLFKPIALAVVLAIAGAVLADPQQRRRILPFCLAGILVGLMAWGNWHLASDGAFSELVLQQSGRYVQRPALAILQELPGLKGPLAEMTRFRLNLYLHARAFPGLDFLIVIGGLCGLWALWQPTRCIDLCCRVLWTLWLALPLLFSFLLWDVAFEHYHVLYLPVLAFLTALWMDSLSWQSGWTRAAIVLLALAFVGSGISSVHARRQNYGPATALRGEPAPLMTLDATVNVLSETESACGIIHFPLPPYGELLFQPGVSHFEAAMSKLIGCLENSPDIRIVIHDLSDLSLVLVDRTFYDYVLRQDPERVIYLSEAAQRRFLGLYSQETEVPGTSPGCPDLQP